MAETNSQSKNKNQAPQPNITLATGEVGVATGFGESSQVKVVGVEEGAPISASNVYSRSTGKAIVSDGRAVIPKSSRQGPASEYVPPPSKTALQMAKEKIQQVKTGIESTKQNIYGGVSNKAARTVEGKFKNAVNTALYEAGLVKPVPEAIEEVNKLESEGKITKIQASQARQEIANKVIASTAGRVPSIGDAVKSSVGVALLEGARLSTTPESVASAAFLGGALPVVYKATSLAMQAPSPYIKSAAVLGKIGITGLLGYEALKLGTQFAGASPSEKVVLIGSAIPQLAIAGVTGYAVESVLERAVPSVSSRVAKDVDIISRATKEGQSYVSTTLDIKTSNIPRQKTTYKYVTDNISPELAGVTDITRSRGGGRAVRGVDIPERIFNVANIEGKTVEVVRNVKTGDITASIFEGTKSKSTQYKITNDKIFGYDVKFSGGKLSKSQFYKGKYKGASERINLRAVEGDIETEIRPLTSATALSEVGVRTGRFETGLGKEVPLKGFKVKTGSRDVVRDIEVMATRRGRVGTGAADAVLRAESRAPDLFVKQRAKIRYELPESGYFKGFDVGGRAVQPLVDTVEIPKALDAKPGTDLLKSEALKSIDTFSSQKAISNGKTSSQLVTELETKSVLELKPAEIPKSTEAPSVPKLEPKSFEFRPRAFFLSESRKALSSKPRTGSLVIKTPMTEPESTLGQSAAEKAINKEINKVFTGSSSRSGSIIKTMPDTLSKVSSKTFSKVSTITRPRQRGKVNISNIGLLNFRLPSYGRIPSIRLQKTPKIGAGGSRGLGGYKALGTSPARRSRSPRRTFLAIPDALSAERSYAKYGSASAPKQTRAIRSEYLRKVVFNPLVFEFKTREQRKRKKKKKR